MNKNQNVLILIESLLRQYSINSVTTIRRGELKRLCDKQVMAISKGAQSEMGHGAFQRCLKVLRDENAITIEKNTPFKGTHISFDPKAVRKLLFDQKYPDFTLENDEIIPLNVENDVLKTLAEKMIRPAATKIDSLARRELITTRAARRLFQFLFSTFFEIYVTDQKGRFEINDASVLRKLIELTMVLASKNPTSPFKLILEYNGPKYVDKSMEVMSSEIYKKLSPDIGLFAEEILQHNFGDKDRDYLAIGHPELLSKLSANAVRVFMNNFVVPKIKDAFTNLSHLG